jgi:pyruvate dehydrogenase (quinone)
VAKAAAPDDAKFAVHRARPVVRPSDAEIGALAAAVNAGKKITIYGGSGCQHAHAEVLALAERLKAPVAFTSRAKDFLEYDNPYAVGMTGIFGGEAGYHALKTCDTAILLGCDFAWRQFYPDKATLIQIDIDGAHLGRRHPVDVAAVGDIAATLTALLPHIQPRDDRRFLDEGLAKHEKAAAKREKHADEGAIHPQYLTETIARRAAPDAVLTADGGSPMVWLLRHVPATGRNRTVISLTHGTMANAMPQALGAAAAYPGRQVIALSGDGGISMLFGDLLTAVQEKLPIKIVVFNNGSLGFVEIEQKVEGLLDAYTDLKNPDFGRVAEAMGLWGRRVERADELDAAVEAWLAAPGPALLDVVTNRFELVMPAHVEASQIFGTALYSAKATWSGRVGEVKELVKNALGA